MRPADGEALAISRYLLNRDCPPVLVERYERGRALVAEVPVAADAVSDFAFRHSWSLPLLDAAAPFVQGGEVLRSRVLLMAAVLEASPSFTTEFFPRDVNRLRLILELAGHALRAGARVLIGVPLLLLVRRHR